MKVTEIHLITLNTDEGLTVLSGGTDYQYMSNQFDTLIMDSDTESAQFVTVKIPEIILTGEDTIIDLTEPVSNG